MGVIEKTARENRNGTATQFMNLSFIHELNISLCIGK